MEAIVHYQRIISRFPEPALLVELTGKVWALNDAAYALFDNSVATGDCLLAAVNEDKRDEASEYLRRCARSRQVITGRLDVTTAKPSFVCHGSLMEPKSEQRGALIFLRVNKEGIARLNFTALKQKITELNREIRGRLKIQKQLEEQTLFLKTTLKSIGEGVIVTDNNAHITLMNPLAETLTGWSFDKAEGRPIDEVLRLLSNSEASEAINGVALTKGRAQYGNKSFLAILSTKAEQQTAVQVTTTPIDSGAKKQGFVTVFHDISEKQQLEGELRARAKKLAAMNDSKNKFMTMLAHELRAPIAPISYATELIKQNLPADSEHANSLTIIKRKVGHLKRLVDDLLDVSRITLGKMNIVKDNLDIASLTKNVCDELSDQYQTNDVSLYVDISAQNIWVNADADRLTQVLHNILYNALKFTPKDGQVNVSLSVQNEHVLLRVSDSGVGVEPTELSGLFEPFSQAEQPLDRSVGGLGLGLSLVKGIVELHDGEVGASSRGRNLGTTIDIKLPLNGQTPHSIDSADIRTVKQLSHKILLIEDDQDTADMMSELLSLNGHSVTAANSGDEGLQIARELKPTFIFCDIGLPEMDGFEVVSKLRTAPDTAETPIVALSGYGEKAFVEKAIATGFDAHIVKPASLQQLQDALFTIRR